MKYDDIPGTPRSSAGFTHFGNYLYWAAGHVGKFHHYENHHFSREFHRLNLETGDWEELENFPVLAQGFRMCGYDGGIYAFGGFVHEGDGEWPVRSTDIVRRYDIVKRKWEDVATLNTPRSSNVIGQVGSLAYLIGGWSGYSKPHKDPTKGWESKPGTFHQTIEIFDLESLKTIDVIPMGISPRRALSALTIGNNITIACGLGPAGFSDLKSEVTSFSTLTKKWTTLFEAKQGRFSPGLAWPRHSPLIVGGLYVSPDHSTYEEFDTFSTFYPHAGSEWMEKSYLNSPRTFAETAIWGESLIVLGGHSGELPVSSVETFNIDSINFD